MARSLKVINACKILILCLGLISIIGCGYGTISPKTYEYAKGLYTISNLKKSDQLDRASKLIEESLSKNEISSQEAGWLNEIISLSKNGNWEAASLSARKMLSAGSSTR